MTAWDQSVTPTPKASAPAEQIPGREDRQHGQRRIGGGGEVDAVGTVTEGQVREEMREQYVGRVAGRVRHVEHTDLHLEHRHVEQIGRVVRQDSRRQRRRNPPSKKHCPRHTRRLSADSCYQRCYCWFSSALTLVPCCTTGRSYEAWTITPTRSWPT